MSDTIIGPSTAERKRTLRSILIALAAHVAVILLISLFASFGVQQVPTPVTIELQPGMAPAGIEEGPGGGPAPAPSAAPPSATLPGAATARAAKAPAANAAGPASGAGGDFVIPVPKGSPAEAAPLNRGPSFQEAGGKTGVAQSLPIAPSPYPQPDATVGPSGKGGSSASSATGSPQRSGQGVATGQPGKGSGGTLDLAQLDKSLAAGAGGAGGTGGGAAARAGSGSGTGSGTGGSGTGGSGSGGTGTGAGAGGPGGGSYRVVFEEAGTDRRLLSRADPKVPAWVGSQGLTLSMTVSFTLMPDGLIGAVALEKSSGYADVDSSVLDAIRRWRFSAVKGTALMKGVIPYTVRPR